MANRRVGVYVDSMNIMRCGGYGMRYEVIRRFVGRDGDRSHAPECLCRH